MKLGIIKGYSAGAFDYVVSKGLEFTEICANFDNESETFIESRDKIIGEIKRTGIPVLSTGRWNALPNKGGKEDEYVTGLIDRSIETAAAIGSPLFNLGVNYDPEISKYKNYCFAVEYLGRRLEKAKKCGIKLALYNCEWSNFLHSPENWEMIIGELPEIGIKFDCSHSFGRDHDYLREIDDWCEHFYHMHIKGVARFPGKAIDDPPAGIDFINWHSVFSLLYAHGYDGTMSIEPHSAIWRGELGEKGIDFTINYVKPFFLR